MNKKQNLVVMIPCYNEAKTVGKVIKSIPKKVKGIDKLTVLVINDGSADNSISVSQKAGAIVVSHKKNEGLGIAFRTGIETALKMGADIIVNIDADRQFDSNDIPKLIEPIQKGEADMVTATRFKDKDYFPTNIPTAKVWGNKGFVKLVNLLTGQKFTDSSCGYRAYSREAAQRLNLFGRFTYTQEVLMNLVDRGMKIQEVPVQVRYFKKRKARVSGSLFKYGYRAIAIIFMAFRDYNPLLFFGIPGLSLFSLGFLFSLFSFIYWLINHSTSPIRMLLFLGVFFLTFGSLLVILSLIADMFKRVRKNQEEIIYYLKQDII